MFTYMHAPFVFTQELQMSCTNKLKLSSIYINMIASFNV